MITTENNVFQKEALHDRMTGLERTMREFAGEVLDLFPAKAFFNGNLEASIYPDWTRFVTFHLSIQNTLLGVDSRKCGVSRRYSDQCIMNSHREAFAAHVADELYHVLMMEIRQS